MGSARDQAQGGPVGALPQDPKSRDPNAGGAAPAVAAGEQGGRPAGARREPPRSQPGELQLSRELYALESREQLDQRLSGLPVAPGCYIFRDAAAAVLYVGKAKSLRSRVRSYFQPGSSDDRAFIPFLRGSVAALETWVTRSEKEAAILENSLIKELRPRFNVKLRDDKEFLTLRLDLAPQWPRLDLVRRPEADRARYYGPFHSATAARRTLHVVEKHFQLRTCTDRELASRSRACLQYQIKRCLGPCVYEVDAELYAEQARSVDLFLRGRHDELSEHLQARMAAASQALDFELAAVYRDQLGAIDSVRGSQRVVTVSDRDQDVVGLYREGDLIELAAVYVRKGRVIDAASFSHPRVEIPDAEVVAGYVREHYAADGLGAAVPDELLLPLLPEGADGVAEWLTERRVQQSDTGRSAKVQLLAPRRGARHELLQLAQANARHAFEEKRRARQDVAERLGRLQAKLRLARYPKTLECIDISHLGGEDTYGSIVCFVDGAPAKKRYRSFRLKGVSGGDDYAAMYEVLSRRLARGAEAEEGGDWALPDLLVVDGGRGQLAVALAAARDLGLTDLPLVGLAKERETVAGEALVDRVYVPGQKNPVSLRANAPELFLLAQARDEAHRFANRARARSGKRRRFGSALDGIAGIGPKTRKILLTRFGGPDALRAVSDEALLATPGVNRRQVEALRAALGAVPSSQEPRSKG